MPTFSLPIEIDCHEVELTVEYSIYGEDRPATFYHPEEYAELDEINVSFEGQPIPRWMEKLLDITIRDACWDDHEGRSRSAEDDRFDYYWQQRKDAEAERWAA